MKKTILLLFITACSFLFFGAAAKQVQQISWDDLIPAHLDENEYLKDLTEEQKDLLLWAINTIEILPPRGKGTEEYYKELDDSMRILKKYGIDFKKIMQKRKEIRTAIVKDLNGKLVRLPGYILPLEVSGSKVTEFLLVPYIGACIHVPPPPPNQIVLVKAADKKGYKSKKLFDPVWVTGVISVESMVRDLFLVDGSTGVDIGYAMQANRIEPYK